MLTSLSALIFLCVRKAWVWTLTCVPTQHQRRSLLLGGRRYRGWGGRWRRHAHVQPCYSSMGRRWRWLGRWGGERGVGGVRGALRRAASRHGAAHAWAVLWTEEDIYWTLRAPERHLVALRETDDMKERRSVRRNSHTAAPLQTCPNFVIVPLMLKKNTI